MLTKKQKIIDVIMQKLELVTQDNGYNTNAGLACYCSTSSIPASHESSICLWPAVEETDTLYSAELLKQPVVIELMQTIPDNSLSTGNQPLAERGIADIKEAVQGSQYLLIFTNGSIDPADYTDVQLVGDTSGAVAYLGVAELISGDYEHGDAAGIFHCRRLVDRNVPFTPAENVSIVSGPSAIAGVTDYTVQSALPGIDGLAKKVEFVSAGVASWPENKKRRLTVSAEYNIFYKTHRGNPYF